MARKFITGTETISSGTTTSEIVIPHGYALVEVKTPASISSTAMYLQSAPSSGGTDTRIYDGLGQYGAVGDVTFTVTSSKAIHIPPALTYGKPVITIEFGSTETSKTFTYTLTEVTT